MQEILKSPWICPSFSDCSLNHPKSWYVQIDSSIRATPRSNDHNSYVGIELMSPAFEFSAATLEQVRYVCYLLHQTEKAKIDHTCAFHVHIGNGTNGFTFDEAKAILALYWTFEPQLQSIQPSSRINSVYSPSLQTESKLVHDIIQGNNKEKKTLEWIFELPEHLGIDELYRQTIDASNSGTGTRPALNLRQLTPSMMPTTKKTVEFRQHEMTLNPDRVTHWISTCHGLVKGAISAAQKDKKHFRDWLRGHIDDSTEIFGLSDLLRHFSLAPEANFYEDVVLTNI